MRLQINKLTNYYDIGYDDEKGKEPLPEKLVGVGKVRWEWGKQQEKIEGT